MLILDSNLLVLYTVGATSRSYISKHKNLKNYTEEDFDILLEIISSVKNVLVTPNTLTETSNLALQIGNPAKEEIRLCLKRIIELTEESYIKSVDAVRNSHYSFLGLTDAALLEFANTGKGPSKITLLTTDLDLYIASFSSKIQSINFNHYRDNYYG